MGTRYILDGSAVDQIFEENVVLPNNTNANLANVVKLNATRGNGLKIRLVADGAVTIPSGGTIKLTPSVGTTTSPATVLPALVATQGGTTDTTYAKGDTILEYLLPSRLLGANTYCKVNIATTGTGSAGSASCYLIAE